MLLKRNKDGFSTIDNFRCCRFLSAIQCWNFRPLFTLTYFVIIKSLSGYVEREISSRVGITVSPAAPTAALAAPQRPSDAAAGAVVAAARAAPGRTPPLWEEFLLKSSAVL